jgi:hypothetical protein
VIALAPHRTALQGYANPDQFAAGIHTRLYARAFIAADSADPSRRFAFVNMDAGMASQAVTFTVIAKLKELYGEELYSEQNVALSGTHTHAGPAGKVPPPPAAAAFRHNVNAWGFGAADPCDSVHARRL